MSTIERNRTIRPSSRQSTSKYRVNLDKVQDDDIIYINIGHESKAFKESYIIYAKNLLGKKNLYFDVEEVGNSVKVVWAGEIIPTRK